MGLRGGGSERKRKRQPILYDIRSISQQGLITIGSEDSCSFWHSEHSECSQCLLPTPVCMHMDKIWLRTGARVYELYMRKESVGMSPEDCRHPCSFQADVKPTENDTFRALFISGFILQRNECADPESTGGILKPPCSSGRRAYDNARAREPCRTELMTDIWRDLCFMLHEYTGLIGDNRRLRI